MELVKVNNQEITVKEYRGQRVVTLRDIDLVHERAEGTAGRNFRENKERFIEGEDYFFVKPSEIQNDEIRRSEINNKGTYLITESGYLMLVKSFTDDLAWTVQRQLVKSYFAKTDELSGLSAELQAIIMHDKKIQRMETRMDKLEFEVPLYGAEADELCNHVKRKGVAVLGGRGSNAYKDTKVRAAVYADIYNQVKREFGLYDDKGHLKSYKALKRKYIYDAHEVIDVYELPTFLREQIEGCNDQIRLEAQ